jgi:hypothetical protein
MDRFKLSELLAGVQPHIDDMRDTQLAELCNVPVKPYLAAKRKPLCYEDHDHKLFVYTPYALHPFPPSLLGCLEN